jgi:hypothetical protein
VFLLAVLVATAGVPVDQPAATGNKTAAAADQRPALVQTLDGFRDWLGEWRQWAHAQTNRRAQSAATALDPSPHPRPSPALLSPSTRSPL